MISPNVYKYSGVLSIILIWVVILFILNKWKPTKHKSISQHAAASREAFIIYTLFISLALLLFTLFVFKWLIPTYHLRGQFSVLAAITIVAEFVTVETPDNGGWKSKIHNPCAFGVALLLPVLLFMLTTSSSLDIAVRTISGLAFVGMLIMLVLFVLKPKTHEKYLVYQSLYYLLFHIPILGAIFIK
jgi:hypothetical protein